MRKSSAIRGVKLQKRQWQNLIFHYSCMVTSKLWRMLKNIFLTLGLITDWGVHKLAPLTLHILCAGYMPEVWVAKIGIDF